MVLRITTAVVLVQLAVSCVYLMKMLFWPTAFCGVELVTIELVVITAFCLIHSFKTRGAAWTVYFAVMSFLLTLAGEYLSMYHGLWGLVYTYSGEMGYKVFGLPLVVSAAWYGIIYTSHVLADAVTFKPGGMEQRSRPARVYGAFTAAVLTGLFVTAWDMMIDPLAVHLGWWKWTGGGAYFREIGGGTPLANFWGWFFIVFLVSVAGRINIRGKRETVPDGDLGSVFPAAMYSLLFTSAAASLAAEKLFLPLAAGFCTMGVVVSIAWVRLFTSKRGVSLTKGDSTVVSP